MLVSKSCRIWREKNLHAYEETPLHLGKVTVWLVCQQEKRDTIKWSSLMLNAEFFSIVNEEQLECWLYRTANHQRNHGVIPRPVISSNKNETFNRTTMFNLFLI